MQGTLTGTVLEASRLASGSVTLKLAGLTPNDHVGVTWIHTVTFLPAQAPAQLPAPHSAVQVETIAIHHVFTGRDGERAGQVRLLGKRVTPHHGRVHTKGGVPFLTAADNTFTFTGHLVRPPTRHPSGKTTARIGVKDRKGQTHYFTLEGWRQLGTELADCRAGAELTVTCILRRDRQATPPGHPARTFDVMELVRFTPAPRTITPRPACPVPHAYGHAAD